MNLKDRAYEYYSFRGTASRASETNKGKVLKVKQWIAYCLPFLCEIGKKKEDTEPIVCTFFKWEVGIVGNRDEVMRKGGVTL